MNLHENARLTPQATPVGAADHRARLDGRRGGRRGRAVGAADLPLARSLSHRRTAALVNRRSALKRCQHQVPGERERPGELLHIDTQKLGRIHGAAAHGGSPSNADGQKRAGRVQWEAVHVLLESTPRPSDQASPTPEAPEAGARRAALHGRRGARVEPVPGQRGPAVGGLRVAVQRRSAASRSLGHGLVVVGHKWSILATRSRTERNEPRRIALSLIGRRSARPG